MRTVWILILITHGCFTEQSSVYAYHSEAECQAQLTKAYQKSSFGNRYAGRCGGLDYILTDTKSNPPRID